MLISRKSLILYMQIPHLIMVLLRLLKHSTTTELRALPIATTLTHNQHHTYHHPPSHHYSFPNMQTILTEFNIMFVLNS